MLKKKGLFLIGLLTFSSITPSEKSYSYYIAGIIGTLIIGKVTYNYFYNHHIPPKQTVEQCQSMLKVINADIQHYYKLYRNDAQISNWELKEIILDYNSNNPYPFLEYYKSLQEALLILQKHRIAIAIQIDETRPLKLTEEGKDLAQQISKIISLITILRMRIQLFKEYHEDCYYFNEKMSNA